jgi:hypothetical protein
MENCRQACWKTVESSRDEEGAPQQWASEEMFSKTNLIRSGNWLRLTVVIDKW